MTAQELTGRVAVVTGAGQSVGRGIAVALAAAGAKVVVAEINETAGAETAAMIRDRGGEALAIRTDVTVLADIEACVAQTVEHFGGLNILVNNAIAGAVDTPLQDTTDEAMAFALQVGVVATHRFMRAAYPHLRGDGRVINLRSGSEVTGVVGMSAYVATKAATAGLTRVAAKEWGVDGITVNAIMPLSFGPSAQAWFEANPEQAEAVFAQQAIRRGGDAEHDIGHTAVFLASPRSGFITGVTINVDGGGVLLT